MSRRFVVGLAVLVLGTFISFQAAVAQQALPAGSIVIKVLTDKKVAKLPVGRPGLYWRLETFPSLAQAQAAAGPWGLAAESGGRAWLTTLGPAGGSSAGGTKVGEIGPLPAVVAPEYLLRFAVASGPPGSTTVVHTHPGSMAFHVLSGEQTVRTMARVIRLSPGAGDAGPSPGTVMQVSSSGSTDLLLLVMFVLDATKPFLSHDMFP